MTAAMSNNGLRFSMKALLGIIALACVVLAIPGGYVLLVVGTVWLLIGAALAKVMMIFKTPIFRALSGLESQENCKVEFLNRQDAK